MDKEHVKGAADKAKGAVKDAAGKVMGDKEMQAEGKMDKAKGAAHGAVGDAQGRPPRTRRRSISDVREKRNLPLSGGFFRVVWTSRVPPTHLTRPALWPVSSSRRIRRETAR